MNYREIVSVTGAAGLYQLVGSKGDGALVRQLGDNVVRFMPGRKHSVTQLETIEIYTVDDNLPLHRIFERMRDSETKRPDQKNTGSDDIKGYFKSVVPELDEDRVYISDMKKILKWYEILETNKMLEFPAATPESGAESEEAPAAAEETVAETKAEEITEEAPAKKAPRKKKVTEPGEGDGEAPAAPKKKAAAKKKDA